MGYGAKLKTGPSTSYMLYTLIVKHINVNITEAQSQRQVWKTSVMLRLLQVKLVLVENGKICRAPEVARGQGSVMPVGGHSSSDSQGLTVLYCRAGYPSKPTA